MGWDSNKLVKFAPEPPPQGQTGVIKVIFLCLQCISRSIALNTTNLHIVILQDHSDLGMWHFALLLGLEVIFVSLNMSDFQLLPYIAFIIAFRASECIGR